MQHDITVLLLAGGKSHRFWPLDNKLDIPIFGSTLLSRQISLIKSAGFNKIVLVGTEELAYKYTSQVAQTVIQKGIGMGAAVLSAAKVIQDKKILIVIADDLVDSSIFESFKQKISHNKNFLIGYQTPKYFPGGYLKLKSQEIIQIIEKPRPGTEPSKFVAIFAAYFTNINQFIEILQKIQVKHADILYEEAISYLISHGTKFEMVPYKGAWIPLKYPWQLLDVMEYYLKSIKKSQISKSAQIHKTAQIYGSVIIEKGVKVMEYAKLVGPLYLGENTVIGNHTLIRESAIGKNCVIGFTCDITRSYLGDDIWLHSNYIGDSIIDSCTTMGAGTTLANLRLDEGNIFSMVKNDKVNCHRNKLGAIIGSNSRIGIGVSTMPGVKIGKNCVIGPGVAVHSDIINDQSCFLKQRLLRMKRTSVNMLHRDDFRQKLQ